MLACFWNVPDRLYFALISYIGVITYILLAGYPPFYVDPDDTLEDSDADPDAIVLKKVLNCDYNFIDSTWKDISPEAIDFIKSLMRPDPRHSVRFLAIISPHLKICYLFLLKRSIQYNITSYFHN